MFLTFLFFLSSESAFAAYFVLLLTAVLIYLLYKETVLPGVSFMAAVIVLMLTGILTGKEALSGFANEKIATVILLVIITAGFRKNYNIEQFFDRFFGAQVSPKRFLLKMSVTVAGLSSFFNNTPIVAAMTPYIYDWANRNNTSPSKLLIPLSYATMLGGMITVVGTSTNLVLLGFMEEAGLPSLHFTDFMFLGLTTTFFGIAYLYFGAYRILPDYQAAIADFKESPKEFLIETQIGEDSKIIGQTVKEAELRNLQGIYLVEIIRNNTIMSPVSPGEVLCKGDLLIFAGKTERVSDLITSGKGLILPAREKFTPGKKMQILEAVIPANSALAGFTVKEADFRRKYHAAVIAVHRNGERLSGKIGNIRLAHGDLLLITAGKEFYRNIEFMRDLYIISVGVSLNAKADRRIRYVFWTLLGLFAASPFIPSLTLFTVLLTVLSLLIILKLITIRDVKKETDLNLIAVLAFAQALSIALQKTGAAELISQTFITLFSPMGIPAVITGLFVLTVILTSFVTNVAAVSIAFPIAYSISQSPQVDLDGTPLYAAIAFAASAAFITPFGYQTNLMVYGPGRYKFGDFINAGLPLLVIHSIVCLTFIMLYYGLI